MLNFAFSSRYSAAALLSILCASCSLTTVDEQRCVSSDECKSAMGVLSVCGGDGFCRQSDPLARCDNTFPADLLSAPQRYSDSILFGTIFDRSLATQVGREQAVQLALSQAQEIGGLLGRPVAMIGCNVAVDETLDDRTRTEAAVFTAEYLSRDLNVWGIVGPAASSDVQAAFLAIQDTDVVMVSPSATSPALTSLDGLTHDDDSPGMLWRTAAPDSTQGLAIASDIAGRGLTNVAVVVESGAYGDELAAIFVEQFSGTSTLFPFNSSSSRDEASLRAIQSDADEVLFVSSQPPDIVAFLEVTAARPADLGDKTLFLTDSAANADVLMGAGGASSLFERVRGTRPALPDGFVFDLFLASFDLAFQVDASQFSFAAHSYDAAWLLMFGVTWSLVQEDGTRGAAVARGLRMLSAGSELDVRASSLGPLTQQFRIGEPVNVNGASGQLDYDPVTEETQAPIEIWSINPVGPTIVVEGMFTPE